MEIEKYKDYLNLTDQDITEIKEAKSKVKVSIPLSILTLVLFVVGFISLAEFSLGTIVIGMLFGISLIITIVKYTSARKVYNDIVKSLIITNLFKKDFENVSYDPYEGFDKKYIDSLEMISKGNTYSSNDLLSATYKGINFTQADVHIEEVTSNGKTTTTVTYFKGRWIIVDFIKNFQGYHQVRSNGGFFKNKKPGKFFGRKVDRIEFESVQFNKDFTSYTDNEKEVYYLITPNMMEKMTHFTEYLNCEVNYGFIDNQLHLAIYNNQNAFEVKGRDVDAAFIQEVEYEMDLIKKVIDSLDLDVDIFK